MTAIQDVVNASQSLIKASVSKIQNAPTYASEVMIAVPTVMSYADNIKMRVESQFNLTWFDLLILIMIPQGNNESAMRWLSDIPQSVGNIFRADPSINGTCQTYAGDVLAVFVKDDSINAVGYRITVQQVKISG